MRTRSLLFLLMVIMMLTAACGSEDDQPPQDGRPPAETPIFNLRPDVLVAQSGNWTLLPASVDFQERSSLVLTASYQHSSGTVTGNISINLFRTFAEARRDFEARLAEWRADANNLVTLIPAFADEAYTLNHNQAGIALVDGDGYLQVEAVGDGAQSSADLLNLLQIGVDVLRVRQPPSTQRGTLGQATRLPPDVTPQP